jgi:FlaG/FlaF family flagellin (archaellin)
MKRVLVAMLVVVLALGLVGCKAVSDKIGEKVGEEIAGKAIGGDVDVKGDEVTIETDDGSVTMDSADNELPDEFPDDFPMYDGVKIDGTSSFASETDITFYVNLTSEDATKDVYEWYKAELADAGWEITSDTYMSGDSEGGILGAKIGETETLTLSVVAGDDVATEIGIMLMQKK